MNNMNKNDIKNIKSIFCQNQQPFFSPPISLPKPMRIVKESYCENYTSESPCNQTSDCEWNTSAKKCEMKPLE